MTKWMKRGIAVVVIVGIVAAAVWAADALVIQPDGTVTINGNLVVNGSVSDSTGALVPVGTILPYAGQADPTDVPPGWLLCNGSAVSRTEYPRLFAVIGTTWGNGDGTTSFSLPNLQGAFLRGTGSQTFTDRHGRSINYSGPNVGVLVDDQMQGHWHDFRMGKKSVNSGSGTAMDDDDTPLEFQSSIAARNPITDGTNGTPRIGAETRPFAAGVNFIIKY